MTLLRYSHHGTGNSAGGEKSATTVVKLAGVSTDKRALLTTIPGVATMTLHHTTKPFQHPPSKPHRNNYHWTRSPHEPSFIQASTTEMIMSQQQQQPHVEIRFGDVPRITIMLNCNTNGCCSPRQSFNES
jgi:hypothetical protein